MCKSFISMNHTVDRDTGLLNDSVNKQKLLGLLVVLFFLIVVVVNLEVSQLVAVLGVGNHTQPVPQVVFLQVLFEVLAVHDAVLDWMGAVNGELEGQLVLLAASLALQLLLAGTLLGAGGLLGYGSHFCFLGGRVSTVTQHFR